jgi:hypothetical protein
VEGVRPSWGRPGHGDGMPQRSSAIKGVDGCENPKKSSCPQPQLPPYPNPPPSRAFHQDMGGAALMLALAHVAMSLALPVRLPLHYYILL